MFDLEVAIELAPPSVELLVQSDVGQTISDLAHRERCLSTVVQQTVDLSRLAPEAEFDEFGAIGGRKRRALRLALGD